MCVSNIPMIESHYDYTGYAYVYNNPMNFIDPFGLDTLPAIVDPKTNELVHDPNAPVVVKEVKVKGEKMSGIEKFFRKLWRAISSPDAGDGNGGTQNAGIRLTKSGTAISPTKQKADYTEQQINIDLLLIGRKGSISVKPSLLNVAKTIKKAGKFGIGIKEAIDKSKGTGVKTDAHGNKLDSKTKAKERLGDSTVSVLMKRGMIGLNDIDSYVISHNKNGGLRKLSEEEYEHLQNLQQNK